MCWITIYHIYKYPMKGLHMISIVVGVLKSRKLVLFDLIRRKVTLCSQYPHWSYSRDGDRLKYSDQLFFITLFTVVEYFYYPLNNMVPNSLPLINAFQRVFHVLKIKIIVREGEKRNRWLYWRILWQIKAQVGLMMKNHYKVLLSCLDHQALLLKISNPKEISFKYICVCPLVKCAGIASLHASLNSVSLQPFLFSLLLDGFSFLLYASCE